MSNDTNWEKHVEIENGNIDHQVRVEPDYDDRLKHNYVETIEKQPVNIVGNNLSWRAILAGLVTFIALSILFSLISAAIGLGQTDVTSGQPLEGVGMGLIIWTIISLIITLAVGGYVSGYTANKSGFVHGFLTWALGLIAVAFLATSAVTGAFNTIGNLLGMTGGAVSETVSTAVETVGGLTEDSFTAITEQLQLDPANLDADVEKALKDSEIEQLQPEYLQGQLDDTVADIQAASKAVLVDGQELDGALENVYTNIQERIATIGEGLDEEELSKAIAENTDLTDTEAKEAVKNIQDSYAEVQKNAETMLTDAEKELQKLSSQIDSAVEEGAEVTEDVMNEASKYSVYTALGLVAAMLITSFAGKFGADKSENDGYVRETRESSVVRK